jgi:excinuclease ABC subunit A
LKDKIIIKGAQEHNLKNINVVIPRDKLIVFTGVSGSGKSSLAFDTLYAEGQRRYVESLSSYARQFLGQMEKPKVDYIEGLSPAISIEQKTASRNPRSTVGTVTEIYDYLRVLYARIGTQFCYDCNVKVGSQTIDQIVEHILNMPERTKIQILAPIVQNRKGSHKEELEEARNEGFSRVLINGIMRSLSEKIELDKKSKHNISIVIDRLIIKEGIHSRLTDSVETALKLTKGIVQIHYTEKDKFEILSETKSCPICGKSYPELSPQHFSFNSPLGFCPTCNGLGTKMEFDPDKIVPDKTLSIYDGAVVYWGDMKSKKNSWRMKIIKALAKHFDFSLKTAWKDYPKNIQKILLYGTKGKRFQVTWTSKNGHTDLNYRYEGIIPTIEKRFKETASENMKRYYLQFISEKECPVCHGKKLRKESLAVKINDNTIDDITSMTIDQTYDFFSKMKLEGNSQKIAEEVLKEICNRLSFLKNVGLHYLTLNRRSPTLSGGESQRIRLASQIGSSLVGVMYVLDEPSIGLHQRDNEKLIKLLLELRDIGNTVLVVEHDEGMMLASDEILDFGPGAGILGGEITFQGPPQKILKSPKSLTGKYLSGRLSIPYNKVRRILGKEFITITKASQNNLKNIDVKIPVGVLTVVTGVSGSGKSSLINQILYPAMSNKLQRSKLKVGNFGNITGFEHFDKVINIDQQPIGRTPRSNPVTYIKAFDLIRKLFSELPASKIRGYKPGRFSFNVKGGRCEACQGAGLKLVEMHFLPDIFVTCEVCNGKRFNKETLLIKYKGKSIADILELDVQEAFDIFENIPSINKKLRTLIDVGLEYIKLGQPATTLSGGEAQRIKLAKELSKTSTGRTLYILDEPTTGLHFSDINKLMNVIQKLVSMGNTVVIIEHNMDVIKSADYIIDLGPEGGLNGGNIITSGTPEEIVRSDKSYTGKYLKNYLL